jgi:predicted RNA methylase
MNWLTRGPEHLDLGLVAGYDQKQGYPDPAEDLSVFSSQGLTPTSTVVDLGAGAGRFALAAARRFGQVTAVDVSPTMLKLPEERAASVLDCSRIRASSASCKASPSGDVRLGF